MPPPQTSNASTALDWLGGAIVRSIFVTAIAAVLTFMLTDDATSYAEKLATTLWIGLLWFVLIESLFLLMMMFSAKSNPARRRRHH